MLLNIKELFGAQVLGERAGIDVGDGHHVVADETGEAAREHGPYNIILESVGGAVLANAISMLGPFGLMDLVGLDVSHAVMKSMYEQYFDEPRYKPSFLAEPRVAAGLLGRKTGRGWYEYGKDGAAVAIAEPAVPQAGAGSVWAVAELRELFLKLNAKLEAKPTANTINFVAPLGKDATTAALELGLDPTRAVAVDPVIAMRAD